MVHWSGWTKHLSVGSSGQLTQHVLHWMSELHCSRHLNFLPKTGSRRLGAVALRHALDGLLRAGCPAARPAPRVLHEEFRGVNFGKAVPGLLEEAARHASGCRRTRKGLPELCVLNGTAVGGLDYELTVRKAAIRHQLTLINGVR